MPKQLRARIKEWMKEWVTPQTSRCCRGTSPVASSSHAPPSASRPNLRHLSLLQPESHSHGSLRGPPAGPLAGILIALHHALHTAADFLAKNAAWSNTTCRAPSLRFLLPISTGCRPPRDSAHPGWPDPASAPATFSLPPPRPPHSLFLKFSPFCAFAHAICSA